MSIYAELVERKGLTQAVAELSSIGLVVAPQEPTEEMRQVAREHFGFRPEEKHGPARERLWLDAWHAFLRAGPFSAGLRPMVAPAQTVKRMLAAGRKAGAPDTLDDKTLMRIYQAMRRREAATPTERP